ncbi:hypothetical protein ABIB25_005322 [Nakamurella sp. UYEF19]
MSRVGIPPAELLAAGRHEATGHTTLPGVWAAGNVVDPRAQVITVLDLALGDWLRTLTPILRTFVLATIACSGRHLRADAAAPPAPQKPTDPVHRQLIRPTLPSAALLSPHPAGDACPPEGDPR